MNFLTSAQGNANSQGSRTNYQKISKNKIGKGKQIKREKITDFQCKEAHEIVPADCFLTFLFLDFVFASFL
jgi:hypothetical protein